MKPVLRLLCVLSVLSWPSLAVAQNGMPYSANVQMPTFISSSNGAGALADGTSAAPAVAFASEPAMGIYRTGSGALVIAAASTLTLSTPSVQSSGDFRAAATSSFYWSGRAILKSPADGIFTGQNFGGTIGAEFKMDALPVASACGAGSPAVVAGSTPMSGSVTVGTGAPATCTITYGGTAFPSAPHCNGAVETTTAANARAMGYSSSTTVLTIVPATAWADSSVVNWDCFSSK